MVVSSKDEQPINRFVDLFNTNKLPSLLNDGAMDPKILKHYLLVHDNQDDSPAEMYTGSVLSCYDRNYYMMMCDIILVLYTVKIWKAHNILFFLWRT